MKTLFPSSALLALSLMAVSGIAAAENTAKVQYRWFVDYPTLAEGMSATVKVTGNHKNVVALGYCDPSTLVASCNYNDVTNPPIVPFLDVDVGPQGFTVTVNLSYLNAYYGYNLTALQAYFQADGEGVYLSNLNASGKKIVGATLETDYAGWSGFDPQSCVTFSDHAAALIFGAAGCFLNGTDLVNGQVWRVKFKFE
jgi:hypothetical protein